MTRPPKPHARICLVVIGAGGRRRLGPKRVVAHRRQIAPAAAQLGLSPEAAARLPEISDADLANMQAAIDANQRLRWVFLQRGFWVNGASDLRDWLQKVAPFTLEGRSDRIRCPVLARSPIAIPWPATPRRRCPASRRRRRS